ncbi:hypothetical protein ABZ636_22175 [Streptomyces sp. NPDC007251]|uniref:hypothetical protein n=1 Tax=unclassified Streptomyces TaxID=2593676 RepID=UPI0033F9461F
MTAFGRTGAMSATTEFGLSPDLITLAKGLSSAYAPISAVMVGLLRASGGSGRRARDPRRPRRRGHSRPRTGHGAQAHAMPRRLRRHRRLRAAAGQQAEKSYRSVLAEPRSVYRQRLLSVREPTDVGEDPRRDPLQRTLEGLHLQVVRPNERDDACASGGEGDGRGDAVAARMHLLVLGGHLSGGERQPDRRGRMHGGPSLFCRGHHTAEMRSERAPQGLQGVSGLPVQQQGRAGGLGQRVQSRTRDERQR